MYDMAAFCTGCMSGSIGAFGKFFLSNPQFAKSTNLSFRPSAVTASIIIGGDSHTKAPDSETGPNAKSPFCGSGTFTGRLIRADFISSKNPLAHNIGYISHPTTH